MRKFTKKSEPIRDRKILSYLRKILSKIKTIDIEKDTNKKFVNSYKKWLMCSTFNTIEGLNEYKFGCYSYGSTTAIAEFIKRNKSKRIRVSKDDFLLTKILSQCYQINLKFLEDEDIKKNDAVVISHPFSGNGNVHPDFEKIIDSCDEHNVDVLIDGSYFGICKDINYPLYRKCIKEFTTSLSKNFGVQDLRIGIRLSKEYVDDVLNAPIEMADCFNKLGSVIGTKLMKKFSADYIIKKYKKRYDKICYDFNLIPTNTITVGLGNNLDNKNKIKFKRGSYIRVCVSNELIKK